MRIIFLFLITIALVISALTPPKRLALGKVKYGGDWYCNKTSLPNLAEFCNQQLKTSLNKEAEVVDLNTTDLNALPLLHLTGHGNIVLTPAEVKRLRTYLVAGGFLHVDDNYGLDKFIRREMKKVFPELSFIEVPFSHPIYSIKFPFPNGLPKVHEHDNKPPRGYGLFYEGRLVCFYTYECDLGNGWEDQSVYNDPEAKRLEALKMGANIVAYAMSNI